jgi:hypothetical protein
VALLGAVVVSLATEGEKEEAAQAAAAPAPAT